MSWELFKELFNGKFFPTCWKLARTREFMSLRQGPNMSIAKYETEFLRLIKYMPLYGIVDVEKGQKFLQGLRIEFQQLMSLVHVESYADIVFKAMMANENMIRVAELKATTAQTKRQSEKPNQISGSRDGKIMKKGKACSRCNKRHPRKMCNGKSIVCYAC